MKVFLSWSGDRSKHVAETLRDWLPLVIQALDPWISVDIAKGQKWNEELSAALKASKVCIVCLTSDNLKSPYIHYEAGAISSNESSINCTFLYEVKEKEVTHPLSAFQNTKFAKEDMYKLVTSINDSLLLVKGAPVKEAVLRKTFEMHWPGFVEQVKLAPNSSEKLPERPVEDMIAEVLRIARRLDEKSEISTSSQETRDTNLARQLSAKLHTNLKRGYNFFQTEVTEIIKRTAKDPSNLKLLEISLIQQVSQQELGFLPTKAIIEEWAKLLDDV
jgi:hypothetical protein